MSGADLEAKLPPIPAVVGIPCLSGYTATATGVSVLPLPLPLPSLPPLVGGLSFSKDRLFSIADHQTSKVMTGWPWFQSTTSGGKHADQTQVVRMGSIGDQSCFYHSVVKATTKLYQNEDEIMAYSKCITAATGMDTTLYSARQRFVDNFRRGIAQWFTQPAQNPLTNKPYTLEEAKRYLNTRPSGLAALLRDVVKDPTAVRFSPFNNMVARVFPPKDGEAEGKVKDYKWAAAMVEDLTAEDEKVREQASATLLETTVGMDQASLDRAAAAISHLQSGDDTIEQMKDAAVKAARFTPDLLTTKLSEKGITRENLIKQETVFRSEVIKAVGEDKVDIYYKPYLHYANESLATGKTVNETLIACGLIDPITYKPTSAKYAHFINYIRTYVEGRRKMIDFVRVTFCDPSTIIHGPYPMTTQNKIVETGSEAILVLLQKSINGRTGLYYTSEEIKAIFDHDPRVGVISDPEILALPLNINYFMVNDGANIRHFNDEDDAGVCTFQLKNLLQVVTPKMDYQGRIIARRDAGEDDIIPMMPFILGVDIYLVHLYGDHMRVYRTFYNSPENTDAHTSPSVVIHSTGGHFEVVGVADDNGVVKTCFEPDHPFIQALHEYLRRLNVGKADHDALYRTFDVAKLAPALSLPMGLPPLPLPLVTSMLTPLSYSTLANSVRSTAPTHSELETLRQQLNVDEATARAIWEARSSPPKLSILPQNSTSSAAYDLASSLSTLSIAADAIAQT